MRAKSAIAASITFLLSACSPSEHEIDNIATISCNIMGESRTMDGAIRLKELNAARKKIHAAAYLGDDDTIMEAFKFGLCEELVKDDRYEEKLTEQKQVAKQLENERIAQEEQERLIQIARDEATAKNNSAEVEAYIKSNAYVPEIVSTSVSHYWSTEVAVEITCLDGLKGKVVLRLKDGLGEIENLFFFDCSEDGTDRTRYGYRVGDKLSPEAVRYLSKLDYSDRKDAALFDSGMMLISGIFVSDHNFLNNEPLKLLGQRIARSKSKIEVISIPVKVN